MSNQSNKLRIAIVGLGPRGLGAIEALRVAAIKKGTQLEMHLFDPEAWPGVGPNYSPDQTSNCILNLPTRAIQITPDQRLQLGIGNFDEWVGGDCDPDEFPTRARLGEYFADRFRRSTACASEDDFKHYRLGVTRAIKSDSGWQLEAGEQSFGPFDEVLLTQGQPLTAPDPQLRRWRPHAEARSATLISAYPDKDLLHAAQSWAGHSVGVRGLGLSTFDVLRVLTLGLGGSFQNGTYQPSGREPGRILPFSLDGQAPLPKPIDAQLDARFDPTVAEADRFLNVARRSLSGDTKAARAALFDSLITPSVRIMNEFGVGVDAKAIATWLASEWDDPGVQETKSPVEALRSNTEIARGDAPPSIEFTIGQIWRKWQDDLRRVFGETEVSRDIADATIGFDEGLKRVSYGPPLRSAEELLALVDCGIVCLSMADDPDVLLTSNGWQLKDDDDTTQVSVMVDAVLPSPTLEAMLDPLMVSLRDAGLVSAVDEDLGVRILPDGLAIDAKGQPVRGLSVFGRMTLGSSIGVDSIHDCFGDAPRRWADGVMKRHVT
ncbi:FAD/NAD(P)-binding protein [Rhodobacteraceae bacterium]|nr:FAD/NAD(P)-binding protein [Paracoccaceae bacterium]